MSGLELAVHRGVRRVALRLASDGRDLPAGRLLDEEEALASAEGDLGVGPLDLDVPHRTGLELDAADGLRARFLLLAHELLAGVLAQRSARRVALMRGVGGEEARAGGADRVAIGRLAAAAQRDGGDREQRQTWERRPHAPGFDLARRSPAAGQCPVE